MKRIPGIIAFIICLPLIGTMFLKPDKSGWKKEKKDASVMDGSFQVVVCEDIGKFLYGPEELVALIMWKIIPEEIGFSSSEDYVAQTDAARDPEQEYLKALAVVCRTNIAYRWEQESCPDFLDFEKMGLGASDFSRIYAAAVNDSGKRHKFDEVKKAAEATKGVVVTKDGNVIAAPFFTTQEADMMANEAGDGKGLSLNYAYRLALGGADFYRILKYFFGDIRISMYE